MRAELRAEWGDWNAFVRAPPPRALHFAVEADAPKWVLAALVNSGGDAGETDFMGRTPLQLARRPECLLGLVARMPHLDDPTVYGTLQEALLRGARFDLARARGPFPLAAALRWELHADTAVLVLAQRDCLSCAEFEALCEHHAAERLIRHVRAHAAPDVDHALRCSLSGAFIRAAAQLGP